MQLGKISQIYYEIFGSPNDIQPKLHLINANISLKAKFELHKLAVELDKVLDFLRKEHKELEKKYAINENSTNEQFDIKAYEVEFNKIMETEVTIFVNPLSIDLFEGVQGVDYCPQFFNLLLEFN